MSDDMKRLVETPTPGPDYVGARTSADVARDARRPGSWWGRFVWGGDGSEADKARRLRGG